MIGTPGVLLFDEPLESLDTEMRTSLLEWMDAAMEAGSLVG